MKAKKILLVYYSIFHLCFLTIAQIDAHYWTHQYGAKGLLLNGAVIASTEDETAIFYNPGAMGRGENFGLSLSFLTPTYSKLTTEDFLGQGTTVSDSDIGFSPGFAAVGFPLFNNKRFKGGATTFTRFKSNLNYRGREIGETSNNNQQLVIGNLDLKQRLTERWLGFGLSYKLTSTLSVGASQFIVLHSQSTDLTIQKEIVPKNRPTQLLVGLRSNLKYSFNASGGFLTKLGLSWKPEDNVIIGLTITTPTYGYLYKRANYDLDDLRKISPDSVQVSSNLNATSLEDYKTPFSIGYGIDFKSGPWRCSVSAEYFRNIRAYDIIDATNDPFNGQTSEVFSQSTNIRTGNKEVFNFAIGLQKKMNNASTLILGFRTDFNPREKVEGFSEFEFLATTPSVYHFSIGSFFELWNNKVSVGIDYGYGHSSGGQTLIDFSNITTENLFDPTPTGNVQTRIQSVVLVFTYDFIFKLRK